ncbi:hypothetical protein [Mycolicibacterium peregrinum]|uniref:hypothetical protein n=1 Tax=Mycolicibacterium peregrinum TaxID=43304 RepID=UPI003AAB2DF3
MTGERQIVAYGLRVEVDGRAQRRTKNPPPHTPYPANFNGAGADLLTFFSSFINALPTDTLICRGDRHFGIPEEVERLGRTIRLRLSGGESGRRSKITLKAGGKEETREPSGVEWEPFRVAIVIPKDFNQGWLLVEKSGYHSVPTEWRQELVRAFKAAYPDYALKISTITEMSLWSQVENSTEPRLLAVEVIMRSSDSSGDHSAGHPANMATYDTHVWEAVHAQPGRVLRQLRRRFTRRKTKDGLVEITQPLDVDDLSDDDAKIELKDDVRQIKARVLNSEGRKKTVIFGGREPTMTIVMDGVFDLSPSATKFWQEARSAAVDLAISGGVSLAPKWDTGEWEHPENAIKVEVSLTDEPDQDDAASAGGTGTTA